MDVARFLIHHGANATAQADDGRTPLSVAAEVGKVEVLRILIEQGIDTMTARPPMQVNHLLYYAFVFCFLFFSRSLLIFHVD